MTQKGEAMNTEEFKKYLFKQFKEGSDVAKMLMYAGNSEKFNKVGPFRKSVTFYSEMYDLFFVVETLMIDTFQFQLCFPEVMPTSLLVSVRTLENELDKKVFLDTVDWGFDYLRFNVFYQEFTLINGCPHVLKMQEMKVSYHLRAMRFTSSKDMIKKAYSQVRDKVKQPNQTIYVPLQGTDKQLEELKTYINGYKLSPHARDYVINTFAGKMRWSGNNSGPNLLDVMLALADFVEWE